MLPSERTRWITSQARAIGFDLCGVAAPDALTELEHLPEWLERGYGGEMKYLRDPRRLAPDRALEGIRSIIVCALNYNTPLPYSTQAAAGSSADEDSAGPRGWISRYAWGDDYHEILGSKLETLLAAMRAEFSGITFDGRAYVDTGPILERIAAKYAGIGWLAKNTCLINEDLGSWLFLGVILTTLDLEPTLGTGELPPPDLCGNCRLCIDACPTEAITAPYVLDARRCISYLTIELRGSIPEEFRPSMGRTVYGCDICQDVCPWNRNAPATTLAEFMPRKIAPKNGNQNSTPQRADLPDAGKNGDSLYAPPLEWLASLTEEEFREMFRGSSMKRAKWRGLVRNACVAIGNANLPQESHAYSRAMILLERLAKSPEPTIVEHAQWAISRLRDQKRSS
jgi:epoxyqueuosine reductase